MLLTSNIMKRCFVCRGKGHHLSNYQVKQVEEKCFDSKKNKVNWNCVERNLNKPKAVCELCHGDKFLFYPHLEGIRWLKKHN